MATCKDCTHRDDPVVCPMWIKQGLCYRGWGEIKNEAQRIFRCVLL